MATPKFSLDTMGSGTGMPAPEAPAVASDRASGTDPRASAVGLRAPTAASSKPMLPPRPDDRSGSADDRSGSAGSAPRRAAPAAGMPSALQAIGHNGHARPQGLRAVGIDFAPYRPPVIHLSPTPRRLMIAARSLGVVWAVVLLVQMIAARSDTSAPDVATVESVGWGGLVVIAGIAISGWIWSDQKARNIRLLDGSLPSRVRCLSAWLVPLATVAVLDFSIARLEPTGDFDVRPMILAVPFIVSMWRPYSLVRRILATLIRIRSDELLVSAYLVDLAAFGLLWRSFTVWTGRSGPVTDGDLDSLIGIQAAIALTLGISVVAWIAISRSTDRAQEHRAVGHRTRYEHRMMRLRGVDPMDPEVWWTLVRRRAEHDPDDSHGRRRPARAGHNGPDVTVDGLIDDLRGRHRVSFNALGSHESAAVLQHLRLRFSTALDADRELLTQAGAVQVEAALQEHRRREETPGADVRMVPPRLYAFGALRSMLVLTWVSTTAVGLWIVRYVLTLGSEPGGGVPDRAVPDLDAAGRLFVLGFVIANTLVPCWSWLVWRHARLLGVSDGATRRSAALAAVSIAACMGWVAADNLGRNGIAFVAVMVSVGCAIVAANGVRPVREMLGLRSVTLVAWLIALPVIANFTLLVGPSSTLVASMPIGRLTFLAVLLALASALSTAFAALCTTDLEDSFKSAPELLVPASKVSRRRRPH
jgi:hypothetical protein